MKNKNYRNRLFLPTAAILLILIFSFPVTAMFDYLDPRFGNNGAVYNHLQLNSPQLLRQSDGKILKFGKITDVDKKYLHRFNADGSIDTGFGNNGQAVFYNMTGRISDVVMQSDGKILFVDKMNGSTYISRINANGWYDSSFGINGSVFLDSDELLTKMSVYKPTSNALSQSIVVLTAHYGSQPSATIRRLNYNGTSSTSFGTNGSINVPGARNILTLTATAVQNAAIYTVGVQSDAKVFIRKYTGNGIWDTTFGTSGSTASFYGQNGGYWEGNFTSFILKSTKFHITIFGLFQFTAATYMGKHSSNGTLENIQSCIFLGCTDNITYEIIGIYSDNTILVDGGSTIRKYSADTTTILDEFQLSYALKDAILQPDGKLITIDNNNTIRRYLP